MRRGFSVGLAILVALALAYFVLREDATFAEAAAPVEKLVVAGRLSDARDELRVLRGRMDPAVADYCEGLLLVAEERPADAVAPLSSARAARPLEWRVAKWLSAALWNAGRPGESAQVVEDYVARVPNDERGLAELARLCVDRRNPGFDPARALAALDRIRALPERVAGARDATSVSDADVGRTRTKALLLAGSAAEALVDARSFVRRFPGDAEGWYLLGDVARLQSVPRADESLAAYRRAAEIAPDVRRYLEQFEMALLEFEAQTPETLDVAEALVAKWPDDPALRVLRARALVRVRQEDAAHAQYRELQRRAESLPVEVRLQVLRNLAVLLADWGAGGRPGAYLEEAWNLLQEYRRLGGEIDEDLRSTWNQLEEEDSRRRQERR